MRQFAKYKLLGLSIIAAIGIVACDSASQDVEPVISPDGYPVATFAPNATSCNEGDTVYFTITTDKPLDRSVTFTFKQTGGTANAEDYTATPAVLLPYTTSVDLMIITWQDSDDTPSETVLGEIGAYSIAEKYLLNSGTVNPTPVTLTINNFVGPLTVDFFWDKNIIIPGEGTYSTANYVDFDFLIVNVEGFDFDDIFASDYVFVAASASHPESFTFDEPDGSYYLIANLFSNAFASAGVNTTIPVTAQFNRQGTPLKNYLLTQSAADAMSSLQPGYDEDGSDFNMIICKIKLEDGKYTIYDTKDTNLGTYKKSGTGKTPRPFMNK